MQILMNENKEIRENSAVSAPYILGQLKQGLLLVENMTRQDKLNVFEYVDLLSGNFVTRLRKDYNLNENNLLLSVLIKLGFLQQNCFLLLIAKKTLFIGRNKG